MDAKNDEAQVSLPSDREILIVRTFKAKKTTLFDAWTKPEHVKRWMGCAELTMPECSIDLRVGGTWRWVTQSTVDGTKHPMSGEYKEIARPDRIVFTERYEPIPGSDHVVTLTFVEKNGRTTLTQHILHASKEARDGHLKSGLDAALEWIFKRLDGVLAAMEEGRTGEITATPA